MKRKGFTKKKIIKDFMNVYVSIDHCIVFLLHKKTYHYGADTTYVDISIASLFFFSLLTKASSVGMRIKTPIAIPAINIVYHEFPIMERIYNHKNKTKNSDLNNLSILFLSNNRKHTL
jgi:hypothetical protein